MLFKEVIALLIKSINTSHQRYGKFLTLHSGTYVARLCTKGLETLRKKSSSKLNNEHTIFTKYYTPTNAPIVYYILV